MNLQLSLFAEENCQPLDGLATRSCGCGAEVKLSVWVTQGLEVCDLTSCPYCSELARQSFSHHPRSVLADGNSDEELATSWLGYSYGGSL